MHTQRYIQSWFGSGSHTYTCIYKLYNEYDTLRMYELRCNCMCVCVRLSAFTLGGGGGDDGEQTYSYDTLHLPVCTKYDGTHPQRRRRKAHKPPPPQPPHGRRVKAQKLNLNFLLYRIFEQYFCAPYIQYTLIYTVHSTIEQVII